MIQKLKQYKNRLESWSSEEIVGSVDGYLLSSDYSTSRFKSFFIYLFIGVIDAITIVVIVEILMNIVMPAIGFKTLVIAILVILFFRL